MGGVADVVSGTMGLFGFGEGEENRTQTNRTKQKTTQQTELGSEGAASQAAGQYQAGEIGNLGQLLSNYFAGAKGDNDQINTLFKNALTKFATGSPNPSPDQLKSATDFVDQTYTKSATDTYRDLLGQAQSDISGRAAQLGRSSTDSSYTQAFGGIADKAARDIANQRGSLIQQRADYLTNQLPQQQIGLLGQGSQFFNSSLNNAINNRLQLLNAATGIQAQGLNRAVAGGKTISNTEGTGQQIAPPASLGARIQNFGNSLDNLTNQAAKAYAAFG